MGTDAVGVTGFGYEGSTIETFIEELQRWNITTLVDVRLNPISRKKGFSKRALQEALAEAHISYLHFPELGNPKDNREGFADDALGAGRPARDRYRELLENEDAQQKLAEVASIAANVRVGVMCFEASELSCHRHEVLRSVRDRLDELVPAT